MNRSERRRQKREEQKLNKKMNQQNFNDIWTTETLPLTDELIEKLIKSGEITQEQLDNAKSFSEDGEQLEWNSKRKSIMSAPQMFGGKDESTNDNE